MAKVKEEKAAEKKSPFEEAQDSLEKLYGKGTVMPLGLTQVDGQYDVISTGSIGFDKILGIGGVALGKVYELMGWEGCLAADTYIKFLVVDPSTKKVQDCKGGTIKSLYKRFHKLPPHPYQSAKSLNSEYFVMAINEEERIMRNPIADVVLSGIKQCFKVVTASGFTIETTKDHKFYVGGQYKPLSDLRVGDAIFIHNNTPFRKKEHSERKVYQEVSLKHYYKGKPKKVNGYLYHREKTHRLIYEASVNGITLDTYIEQLNSGQILPENFWKIPEGFDVHHEDENTTNNDISNLVLIESPEHSRIHALNRHNNLRFVATPDQIVSIEDIGEKETYDIKCFYPYNNFVAAGFVVHNSGKSTICGHISANFQKQYPHLKLVYIDGEHALDIHYFKQLGVDTNRLLIAQPDYGEQGFTIAEKMISCGEVGLVIIDSDSSLLPKTMMEGEMGESAIGKKARLNSDCYPKLKRACAKHHVCLIVISQYREKIGVMFGNPTTTQGGHALKFYTDARIEVSKSLARDGQDVVGNRTTVKASKNKMAPPHQKAEFDIIYGQGIDRVGEVMEFATALGIIIKSGSWYSYRDDKLGQGASAVLQLLKDTPEFFQEIEAAVIAKLNNQ